MLRVRMWWPVSVRHASSPCKLDWPMVVSFPRWKNSCPTCSRELVAVREQLEKHYRDMHEIEFTIQKGKLFMLQTRSGKRTTPAAIRIAVDMANEGPRVSG